MSDHMKGNPHAEASAVKAGVEELNEHWGIAQATLALAYEQRTANLVQYVRHIDDTDYELQSMIAHRLGLNDD